MLFFVSMLTGWGGFLMNTATAPSTRTSAATLNMTVFPVLFLVRGCFLRGAAVAFCGRTAVLERDDFDLRGGLVAALLLRDAVLRNGSLPKLRGRGLVLCFDVELVAC